MRLCRPQSWCLTHNIELPQLRGQGRGFRDAIQSATCTQLECDIEGHKDEVAVFALLIANRLAVMRYKAHAIVVHGHYVLRAKHLGDGQWEVEGEPLMLRGGYKRAIQEAMERRAAE